MVRKARGHPLVSLTVLFCAALLPRLALGDAYQAVLARALAARDRALDADTPAAWNETLNLFAIAVDLQPSKETKFEMGAAASHLNLVDEAYAAFAEALDEGLEGRAATKAREFIHTYVSSIAVLQVDGPAGATVYVRSRRRGVLPLRAPLIVSSGVFFVRVEAPGLPPWEREISIGGATSTMALHVTLPPPETPLAIPSVMPAQVPSIDSRNSPPRRDRWAWPALVGGAAVATAGAATVVVATLALPEARARLARNCPNASGDECRSTTSAMLPAAQSAANDVVTLRNVRWIGIGATALGVAMASISAAALLWPGGPAPESGATISFSGEGLELQWQARF